ncbi:S1/P1 nuclease [Botrimarina mediterranea]|uniref:S1/P1 nuclease n=1 Tax=Botrimarina mediterranea TaxID=2528022 RepID=UPI001188CE87|nr:S1/P1 Nuclease [Planctomycetes bacterium K2D]
MPHASRIRPYFAACAILLSLAPHARAWSEGGHHLIGLLAYHLLDADEKAAFQEMLAAHPRFADDFKPPGNVANPDRWRAGRAGYWPDVARRQPTYNRPDWHWEDAVTLVVGNRDAVQLPNHVTRLPRGADLDSKDLHASQATVLCQRVMGDATAPASDRAIALCWLGHLVADVHQPCHAGSLYAASVFPRGDRGGNSIDTKQRGNLHALWDGLLGPRYNETSENRRFAEIVGDADLMARGERAAEKMDPLDWLEESRLASVKTAYTNEVLAPVRAVAEGRAESMPVVTVSPEYLETAGRMATLRACQAGWRLASVWRSGLAAPIERTTARVTPSESMTSSVTTMAPADADAVGSYWLNTKTGVRHNASCRNFENTKGGRNCNEGEGKPCGICGG